MLFWKYVLDKNVNCKNIKCWQQELGFMWINLSSDYRSIDKVLSQCLLYFVSNFQDTMII